LVDKKTLDEVALTESEYNLIVEKLGREPNHVELGIFGAMWSEHCGYKNSKPLLKLFPQTGPFVLQGPGENAGALDIGDGLAVVMKIESHNHPSAIEPYEGAATGVGGIVRDIFTMGARPVALLNSLRFGPLTEPHNRYLFQGVVAGIGDYGNCIGVPTVGGEVYFADTYSGNPLVNAMCVGIAARDGLIKARAEGEGNPIILVGADTGRDGIHGATFASVELTEASEERRPAVQVGNPFLEKLLIEACLELATKDYVIGVQDLGAAGLTSSSVESADKGHSGVELDISKVSRREKGMTAYDVMLSESQERMFVVVKKGHEADVQAIFDKWGLHSDIIGHVTTDHKLRVKDGDETVAEIPVHLLTEEVPMYVRQGTPSKEIERLANLDITQMRGLTGAAVTCGPGLSYNKVLLDLLSSPNIASKRYVYRQYDHTIQTNSALQPGVSDAAVVRIKHTNKAIALTTDCNGRYCYLDPRVGGKIAVAEAARNLACTGALPMGVTDCLNFGNPEKPEIYFQLEQAIRGMAEACEKFATPVISGNVSLYNESSGEAIYPTPVVGMVGLINDVSKIAGMAFKEERDAIVLLGPLTGAGLGASQYLETIYGQAAGRPDDVDFDTELRVQGCCREAIEAGLVKSAHDCSDGGLAVALAECCIVGGTGAAIADLKSMADEGASVEGLLFGEEQSRIILTISRSSVPQVMEMASRLGIEMREIGTVGGDKLVIGSWVNTGVDEMRGKWENALADLMSLPYEAS
jgi:phosphoribosylformylglycinamidine synthase subunit PurL